MFKSLFHGGIEMNKISFLYVMDNLFQVYYILKLLQVNKKISKNGLKIIKLVVLGK